MLPLFKALSKGTVSTFYCRKGFFFLPRHKMVITQKKKKVSFNKISDPYTLP